MGCTSGCVKSFLTIFNILNALLGISLIAIATIFLSEAPVAYIVFLYGLGGMIIVSSILGCCGICQENVCMTATYGFLLLGQLVISLLGTFTFNFNEGYIVEFADAEVQNYWDQELVNPGAMDILQKAYECCGRNSADDYVAIGRSTLPASCYPDEDTEMPHYMEGCDQKSIQSFVMRFNYSKDTIWIAVGITALMVIAAFYLAGRFRKQRIRYHH